MFEFVNVFLSIVVRGRSAGWTQLGVVRGEADVLLEVGGLVLLEGVAVIQ